MSKPYASKEARLALSNRLLKAAGGNGDGATEREKRHDKAFERFLRVGRDGLSADDKRLLHEFRDLGEGGLATGLATNSAVLVPQSFQDAVVSSLKQISLLDLCDMQAAADGRPFLVPQDSDASSGVTATMLPENTQLDLTDISGISQTEFTTLKAATAVRVSRELLDDQQVNIVRYLGERFGVRMRNLLASAGTNGNGSAGEYLGFMNSPTIQNVGTAQGATGWDLQNVAISASDCALLEQAIDPAYRANPQCVWMCHPSTLQSLRGYTTTTGAALYPGLSNSPDGVNRIFNRIVATNSYMDVLTITPNSPPQTLRPLALCDFSKLQCRLCDMVLWTLWERWAEFYSVGFIGLLRCAGFYFTDQGRCAAYLQVVN
jgi:HK97 family phage major capsid protein